MSVVTTATAVYVTVAGVLHAFGDDELIERCKTNIGRLVVLFARPPRTKLNAGRPKISDVEQA
jgi:hypothetical protein